LENCSKKPIELVTDAPLGFQGISKDAYHNGMSFTLITNVHEPIGVIRFKGLRSRVHVRIDRENLAMRADQPVPVLVPAHHDHTSRAYVHGVLVPVIKMGSLCASIDCRGSKIQRVDAQESIVLRLSVHAKQGAAVATIDDLPACLSVKNMTNT
jgi:hypothetical protein